MTTFEQELDRAIEHGCPKCDWYSHYFDVYDGEKVDCAYCLNTLWTVADGWIPELQGIIRGE
jgi:hypothetical protein